MLGIPHLNNRAGLRDLIASIDVEALVCIINNSDSNDFSDLVPVAPATTLSFKVVYPGKPKSVAESWNLLAAEYARQPHANTLVIANDDVVFAPGSLAALAQQAYYNRDAAIILTTASYSCFAWNLTNSLPVGLFDEAFFPAYFEDCDYDYRLKLAGKPALHTPIVVHHVGSQTIAQYSEAEMEKRHHQFFRRNQNYYRAKWGGGPGEETNTRPFESAYWSFQ